MPEIDIAQLAKQITPEQLRQLNALAASDPEWEARKSELEAEVERAQAAIAAIAEIIGAAPAEAVGTNRLTTSAKPGSLSPEPPAADAWLKAFLESGGKAAVEVLAAGREAGFTEGMLRRAAKRIGVVTAKGGFQAPSVWRLAGGAIPAPGPVSAADEKIGDAPGASANDNDAKAAGLPASGSMGSGVDIERTEGKGPSTGDTAKTVEVSASGNDKSAKEVGKTGEGKKCTQHSIWGERPLRAYPWLYPPDQ